MGEREAFGYDHDFIKRLAEKAMIIDAKYLYILIS